MSETRRVDTATRLADGRVLEVGGENSTADLYDPATNSWTAAAAMPVARSGHSAGLLQNGEVLVAGGSTGFAGSSSEISDAAPNTWRNAGSMTSSRAYAAGVVDQEGNVLVAGGDNGNRVVASADLFIRTPPVAIPDSRLAALILAAGAVPSPFTSQEGGASFGARGRDDLVGLGMTLGAMWQLE